MSDTQTNEAAKPATASKKKAAAAGKRSMTPEQAAKLGLDPKPYGKPAKAAG